MTFPRIARVEIQWSENSTVPKRAFASLAAADRALADAFQREPPPQGGGYDKTGFLVVWTDGKRHEGRADVREEDVRTAVAAGGILRQHLGHVGTWLRDKSGTYEGFKPDQRADYQEWGAELLRRLDAEPPMGVARNAFSVPGDVLLPVGTTDPEPTPTLLPDPIAAVDLLEARFAAVRPAIGWWQGRLRVPNMTNRDIRFATNWLSVALAHDLPALRRTTGHPHGQTWDLWRKHVTAVSRALGEQPDAAYPDAVGFWNEQARELALTVAEALHRATARNTRAASWGGR